MKVTVTQNNTADLIMLKKKLKKRKKKLKEEVSLWEESRRCSNGHNEEPEQVEPPSNENTKENGEISQNNTGMRACTYIMFPCQHSMFYRPLY